MSTGSRTYSSINDSGNGRVLTKNGTVFTLSTSKNVHEHEKILRGLKRNETVG